MRTTRSRSRSRGRSPQRKSPSRKSPSRKSPSRKSPSRKSKSPSRSRATKAKRSPSPSRSSKSAKQVTKTLTTPTRISSRIQVQVEKQEIQKVEQFQKELKDAKPSSTRQKKQTPETKPKNKYEFGGPIISFLLTLLLPAIVLGLNLLCNKNSCSLKLDKLPTIPMKLSAYYHRDAVLLFFGYLIFQAFLASLPIGYFFKGRKDKTLRCNGFFAMFINLLILAGLIYFRFPVTMVYDKFVQLTTTAICFSFLVSFGAYMRSRKLKAAEKSEYGNSGCFTHDFFVGREMNPQVGSLTLKLFYHRFAMTSWGLINAVFMWKAYSENTLTATLALVSLFQGLYIVDSFIFEDSVSSRLEMRATGFGFRIAFAYIALVPFTYTLQTRFLLEHPVQWNACYLAGFMIMNMIGFIIYRGANSEKDHFRRDPHNTMFAAFKKIPSPSGHKLLASGWWGLCRHPNYLGDCIMALAWTIPCGCQGACLTWFYPVFLAMLLLNRARVSDIMCQKKHGAAWDRYCREVKYTLIPKVY